MPSQSTVISTFIPSTFSPTLSNSRQRKSPNHVYQGFWSCGRKNCKPVPLTFNWKCDASVIGRKGTKDDSYLTFPQCRAAFKNEVTVIKWPGSVEVDLEGLPVEVSTCSNIERLVSTIKSILGSLNDGEITISPYDTAWVALLENLDESGTPQFPSSLQWIAANQLPDGSWGDTYVFKAHDRILNTLACVVALRSWNVYPDKQERGMAFLEKNLSKLAKEDAEHMPIGFEVAFPSLMDIARDLGIFISCDSLVLQNIYDQRSIKLTRIPKDILHRVPTTLLHSLEGMPGLDWEKLLKLQCQDGSFLFSPASTAYAFMQTKDLNCLRYIKKVVQRFGGGVPNVYPVDLFEHLWTVDRVLRLGIARYFQQEIKECMDYVYRYWTEQGICWARNSNIQDIDDTAMGFRLLRLYGYEVSPDVFENFKKDGEFFCFAGQSTQAKTGIYNLYRASQLQFVGERVLEEARRFSFNYLKEKQASNELLDKWIIIKDLPGEVGFALEIPWYANLPRIETRFYIEQYGGEEDVWIGKTLYRMPYVNNNMYFELAKLDYNNCQEMHRLEWDIIKRWYEENNLVQFGLSQRTLLELYFVAASSIFEPGKSQVRLAWAKTAAITEAITSYFSNAKTSIAERRVLTDVFWKSSVNEDFLGDERSNGGNILAGRLLGTLNELSTDALRAHGRDIKKQLYKAWEKWLMTWQEESPYYGGEAELLISTILLFSGFWVHDELSCHPQYHRILRITNEICQQLADIRRQKAKGVNQGAGGSSIVMIQLEEQMKGFVELVLRNSSDSIDFDIKHIFLHVVKSFYYAAHCSEEMIDYHIEKVLSEKVQ